MADADNTTTTDQASGTPATDDTTALKTALEAERKRATDAENQLKQVRLQMANQAKETDASKTELEKLADRVTAAEERANKAERQALVAEISRDKKLPPALAKRLTGSTAEELAADADDLLAAFGPAAGDNSQGDKGATGGTAGASTTTTDTGGAGRPKEALHDGAAAAEDADFDPKAVADDILR
jgi:hypothetical protein